jgi:hypothetical protein
LQHFFAAIQATSTRKDNDPAALVYQVRRCLKLFTMREWKGCRKTISAVMRDICV